MKILAGFFVKLISNADILQRCKGPAIAKTILKRKKLKGLHNLTSGFAVKLQ